MYRTAIIGLVLCAAFRSMQASIVVETRTTTEREGRDVLLSCRFERLNERDRVMWSKDGVILSVNEEISGDRKKYQIINRYDLMVKTIDDSDTGRYLCQNFDQVMSMNIELTVLTRPSQPEFQPTNQSLIENTSGKLLCLTRGGTPLPTFSWLINQVKINESFFKTYPNADQSYSELTLPLEKRFHHGLLTCQIENQALEKPLIVSQTLNILYKPEVNLRHGQNVISNLNLLFIENDHITLDCQSQSNPPSSQSMTWLKNGALIPGLTSSSLTLSNIKRLDDGEYTCLTSNSIGHGQASVHIRVQYPPIVQLNGGGVITEYQRLILVCNVDAYPPIDSYVWYKNNEKLNISSSSSLVIERVSRSDSGIYLCMVKNTLKYSNGSSIERFNQTQIRVTVQYVPRVQAISPILAVDMFAHDVQLSCDIDSFPESAIFWTFHHKDIFPSHKYTIIQNKSRSYLIIKQVQSNADLGFYSCNASNKLGSNSTTIQLRSKDVPESPTDLNVTSKSYSSISLQWKPAFDGGWPQSYWVSLNNGLWRETNQTQFTFTNLQHLQHYNVTVRAFNRLGQSVNYAALRAQTNDVPIKKQDLPLIQHAAMHVSSKTIEYRLNDSSFSSLAIPLCLRLERHNRTNICQSILTPSGSFKLDSPDLTNVLNVSLCLEQYENYCGKTMPIAMQRDVPFNWIFILIASIAIVSCLILCGLCIFCFILRRKRRRNAHHNSVIPSAKITAHHPIIIEPTLSNATSPTKFFSNVTYPEQQQVPSSYSKVAEIQKLDQCQGPANNHRQLSSITSGSSDPIVTNPNSSSLSVSDQLTVTDLNPADLSQMQTDFLSSTSPYVSFGFPYYSTKSGTPSNKEETIESGYSTPLKSHQPNKKTVYEVVV